jgi:rRNA processing protein Gar1
LGEISKSWLKTKENKVIIKEWRKIIGEDMYPKRNKVEKRTRKKKEKKNKEK